MDISLLNQNLVVCFSLIAATAVTFIITHARKKWFKKKRPFYIVGISLAGAIIIEVLVHLEYSSGLPTLLWLMVFPFTFSIGVVVPAWKNKLKWLKWLALGNVVVCFAFSLILINGYYRLYPTLYSVFNVEDRKQALEQTTVKYSNSVNQKTNNTIESSLYSSSKSTNGRVFSLSIPGKVSKFQARTAWVYMPAVASSPGRINLPVVVLTAGYPGLPSNWIGSGLATTMDQFAKLHHGITPIIFMVDNTGSLTNDTECVNSPRGNVETYLTVDVPNYIKAHYEVSDNPANWAIGGLSLGGTCSVMLALRHPNIYHYFLDFGGEIGPEVGSKQKTIDELFDGSEQAWAAHQPLLLLQKNKYKGMGGYFAIGNDDNLTIVNDMGILYQASKAAGIESIYEEIGGQHTFAVWQQAYKDALPWLSNRLGATECSASCTQ